MAIKKYTDEELLQILLDYNDNIGFPTQREFKQSNGLPSSGTYFNRFGSFRDAIVLSGIEIPNNREKFFNRERLSDEVLLNLLKQETNKKLESNLFLLTEEDVDNNYNLPSVSVYYNRFGNLKKAYEMIGINSDVSNNNALEKDMLLKYINLCDKLGYTADSREINEYSQKGVCYGITTYLQHFESLHNLQKITNRPQTIIGKNITKQEMILLLQKLGKELGRNPTRHDLKDFDYLPSLSHYNEIFGSFTNALKKSGFKNVKSKTIITNQGTKCYSYFEYKLVKMLENYKIPFDKEVKYKKFIKGFNREYRFDCVLYIDNKIYCVEVFGIIKNKKYDIRKQEKIDLCNEHNIPLIIFEQPDLWSTSNEKINKLLFKKINELSLVS